MQPGPPFTPLFTEFERLACEAKALTLSCAGIQRAYEAAQEFGFSTWGYALLVYGPGALFWAVFDLYRLSKRATTPSLQLPSH